MNKMIAYTETVHCMKCYLRDIRTKCPYDYYRKRRVEVLEVASKVVDAVHCKVLEKLIEEMEAEEMEAEENA